jgi:mannosyltransferase
MQPPEAAANQSTGDSSQSRASRAVHWAALLLLLAADIAIRMQHLASKPFWFDETFSVEVARIGWRDFVHLLWWREANMSLYYVLLRAWLPFGQSQFFIRALSVLLSAATVPAIYWLARLLYNRRVALIAAALLAFNAFDVRYAQEARTYALFLLLATVASGALIASLREAKGRSRKGYVVASVLAVYAHFYALLLLAAHWLALRWRAITENGREQARSNHLRRSWRIIGLAVLPLLIFVAKTGAGPIRWITRPGARDLFEFFEHLAGANTWLLLAIYAVACVVATAPLGKTLFARNQTWETWRCQFLLIWLLLPIALTFILSFARPVFLPRYMIFCLPPFIILAAAGLARLRPSWVLAAALTGTLLLSMQGILFIYGHDFDNERDAAGAATNFILDHSEPGDALILHGAATRAPYEFFLSQRTLNAPVGALPAPQIGPEILFPHNGAALEYRDFMGKPTADLLRTIPASHQRVWVMLMNNQPNGIPDATTVMLTQTLPDSFPRVQRWQFPKVEVRLYSRHKLAK